MITSNAGIECIFLTTGKGTTGQNPCVDRPSRRNLQHPQALERPSFEWPNCTSEHRIRGVGEQKLPDFALLVQGQLAWSGGRSSWAQRGYLVLERPLSWQWQ